MQLFSKNGRDDSGAAPRPWISGSTVEALNATAFPWQKWDQRWRRRREGRCSESLMNGLRDFPHDQEDQINEMFLISSSSHLLLPRWRTKWRHSTMKFMDRITVSMTRRPLLLIDNETSQRERLERERAVDAMVLVGFQIFPLYSRRE